MNIIIIIIVVVVINIIIIIIIIIKQSTFHMQPSLLKNSAAERCWVILLYGIDDCSIF